MLHVIDELLPSCELQNLCRVCDRHAELRPQLDGPALFSWLPTTKSSPKSRSVHSADHQQIMRDYLKRHLLPLINHFAPDHIGVEWWCNTNNDLDWHIDKDETTAARHGRHDLPLLSTVFYPHIQCAGGELLVSDNTPIQPGSPVVRPEFRSVISIPPLVNRLVLFSPGILHRINPFEGERFSVAVNVWGHPLSQDAASLE